MDRRPPRMQDIAAKSNVSIGTVSRVLNGKSDVDSRLAEKVLTVARRLGYERKAPRQPRPAGGARTIGYLVDTAPDEHTYPYQQNILASIQQSLNGGRGHLMFALCNEEVQRDAVPSMVGEGLVQGVIVKASRATPDAWLERLGQRVPMVLLMHQCASRSISAVDSDAYLSVFQPLEYLRGLGHTKIGFLGVQDVGSPEALHHVQRREAFLKCHASLGCEAHPGYIQSPTRDHGSESLIDAVDKALAAYWALGQARPTAVLCATDIYAASLMAAAARRGLRIPEDLSVVGIMNSEAGQNADPPLTSVSLCQDDVGRAALTLLLERIENPGATVRHIQIGTRLVVRGSCAAPAFR